MVVKYDICVYMYVILLINLKDNLNLIVVMFEFIVKYWVYIISYM